MQAINNNLLGRKDPAINLRDLFYFCIASVSAPTALLMVSMLTESG